MQCAYIRFNESAASPTGPKILTSSTTKRFSFPLLYTIVRRLRISLVQNFSGLTTLCKWERKAREGTHASYYTEGDMKDRLSLGRR